MNKDEFLKFLHNQYDWKAMLEKGAAGVAVKFNGVTFNVFRDDAEHFLTCEPCNSGELAVIEEFNALMESCRPEISAELQQAEMARLNRNDNEGDPIG